MRQLIGQRQGEGTPRSRSRNLDTVSHSYGPSDLESLHALASEADRELVRAAANHERLQVGLLQVTVDFKEVRPRQRHAYAVLIWLPNVEVGRI